MDLRSTATKKQDIAVAIQQLKNSIGRFIEAAESDAPTARMKMLEVSIEIAPAMENVVKAVTGAK